MSVLGGHGLMEDFSALPRLYRDAVVLNGAWEGPRNLLLTRIFMDIKKSVAWYEPQCFVRNLLETATDAQVKQLSDEITDLIQYPTLTGTDSKTIEVCQRWDQLCTNLFHCYQQQAFNEIN